MLVSNDNVCLTETKMDDLDSFDFDGFTCFMTNRSIYKRKSGVGGWGGGIALLVRNRILNMVKIVEHVDFQRRIEKSLRKFYRFVDFFNDGLFFFLNYRVRSKTTLIVRNYLSVLYIYLQKGLSTVTEALLLSWKKHFYT